MKYGSEDIARIAESLRAGGLDQAQLAMTSEVIRHGAGSKLFQTLVDQERHATNADSEPTVVAGLMRRLEQLMPEDAAVGAYLMGRLYGFAWKTSDHSVFNGIELWMHSLVSLEAANALLQLSREPVRPALKKLCSSWAKLITEKSSQRQ